MTDTSGSSATPPQARASATQATPASQATQAEADWTDQVTDLIVHLVESVRDKTTGPILKVARMIVYGLVALVVVGVLAVLGLALVGRSIALIPIDLWISYLALGAIMVLLGRAIWSKRA